MKDWTMLIGRENKSLVLLKLKKIILNIEAL